MVPRRARFKRRVNGSSDQRLVRQLQLHRDELGVVARYLSAVSFAEHSPVLDNDGTDLRMMLRAVFGDTLPRLVKGFARELPQRIPARLVVKQQLFRRPSVIVENFVEHLLVSETANAPCSILVFNPQVFEVDLIAERDRIAISIRVGLLRMEIAKGIRLLDEVPPNFLIGCSWLWLEIRRFQLNFLILRPFGQAFEAQNAFVESSAYRIQNYRVFASVVFCDGRSVEIPRAGAKHRRM